MFYGAFKTQLDNIKYEYQKALKDIENKQVEFNSEYRFEHWSTRETVYKKLLDRLLGDVSLVVARSVENQLNDPKTITTIVEKINKLQLKKGK